MILKLGCLSSDTHYTKLSFSYLDVSVIFSATPAIIDIEASGFGPDSYPIEIGIILPKGERFCKLIRPYTRWSHWDTSAQATHGITREDLMDKGEEPIAVCLAINEFVKGTNVYSDAWVVDSPWITKLFVESAVPMQFTVSAIELIMNERQIEIWDEEKHNIIKGCNTQRHRASADAFVIQETFLRTQKRLAQDD